MTATPAMDLPVFEETWRALWLPPTTGRHRWHGTPQPVPRTAGPHKHSIDAPTQEITVVDPDEPTAATAGEQDHEDPWQYAADEYADAPADSGRPAEDA